MGISRFEPRSERHLCLVVLLSFAFSFCWNALALGQNDGELKGASELESTTVEVDEELFAIFDEREIVPAIDGQNISYRLFTPNIKQGTKYPLIIWLNGNRFDDEQATAEDFQTLRAAVFQAPKRRNKYPFFFAIADLQNADSISKIVDDVTSKNSVDLNRVMLMGVARGSNQALAVAASRPDIFSAIVCLGFRGSAQEDLERLKDVPIWVFHNSDDKPADAKQLVSRLKQVGSKAVYLEVGGTKPEDSWSDAFGEYELLSWLLKQEKVQPNASQPGSPASFGEYWPQAGVVGIILVCVIAVKLEGDRKRKRKLNQLPEDGELHDAVSADNTQAAPSSGSAASTPDSAPPQ